MKCKNLLVVCIMVALVSASCNTNPTSIPTDKEVRSSKYSGEDLFKGIMFADGQVADVIPEISKVKNFISLQKWNDKEKAAYKTLQDSIIAKIKRADPGYFSNFQFNVQSGDQVLISSAMRTASVMIKAALAENNRKLAPLLNNRFNASLKNKLNNSAAYKKLYNTIGSGSSDLKPVKDQAALLKKELNPAAFIDVDIDEALWNNLSFARALSINSSLDIATSTDQDLSKSIAALFSLDINKNLQQQFDRTDINKARDRDLGAGDALWVDNDVAIYSEVAAVVYVAAVVVWVLERPNIYNDKGNVFNEQLVNSVAVNLKVAR